MKNITIKLNPYQARLYRDMKPGLEPKHHLERMLEEMLTPCEGSVNPIQGANLEFTLRKLPPVRRWKKTAETIAVFIEGYLNWLETYQDANRAAGG